MAEGGYDPDFEFNAPQFLDFNNCSDDEDSTVEEYFRYDHEGDGRRITLSPDTVRDSGVHSDFNDVRHVQRLNESVQQSLSVVQAATKAKRTMKKHQPRRSPRHRVKKNAAPIKEAPSVAVSPARKRQKPEPVKVTVAVTPMCLKRGNGMQGSRLPKTTAQLEAEKIAELRKEAARVLKASNKSKEQALKAYKYQPVKKNQHVEPEEFHFATDRRLRSGQSDKDKEAEAEFVHSLRNYHEKQNKENKPLKLTKPKPFHLHETKAAERNTSAPSSPYVSLAEGVQAFTSRTPARFRQSKRIRSKERIGFHAEGKPALTMPKTPNLQSRFRHRPNEVVSQAQKEEEEIEEMHRNQFKAHPVNTKVLKKANVGVKKVEAKPPTIPEEFALTAAHPLPKRHGATGEEKEDHFVFHAKPVSKAILKGTTGLKAKEAKAATIPESPAFALKHRVKIPKPAAESPKEGRVLRSRTVPHSGVPFRPQLEHHTTEPVAFSFAARDAARREEKERKIQKVYEEERLAREFKATGLPDHNMRSLGVSSKSYSIRNTKPLPFHLQTDARGEMYYQRWKRQIEEERKEELAQASGFKAKSCDVVFKEPFHPEKSHKPATTVDDFHLNTEIRAEARAEFDTYRTQKEMALAEYIRSHELKKIEEEEREIAEIRKAAVHKAAPVRHYKGVVVKRSEKMPTVAQTPVFATSKLRKKRRRSSI